MINTPETITRTSHIIIPASVSEIYFHTKNKYANIAFFGWKIEPWESTWQVAIRELEQETSVQLWQEQLEFVDKSTVKLNHWEFESTLYRTPMIPNLVWDEIGRISIEDLEIVKATFMPERKEFIRRVELALSI